MEGMGSGRAMLSGGRRLLGRLWFSVLELPCIAPRQRRRLERLIHGRSRPRVAFVKQDIQDDLYFCARGSSPREIVHSTLLRPGPVALFTHLRADAITVNTEADAECCVWREKVDALGWYPSGMLEGFRASVPGRSCGYEAFAVPADAVDWGAYDIVVSVDVSVPARITQRYPQVAWCYYVREFKSPSYVRSHDGPVPGQDLHLNHLFHPRRLAVHRPHEVDFPYHLHYFGCFDELEGAEPVADEQRSGVFLEHHTGEVLTREQLDALSEFGPVTGTSLTGEGLAAASPNPIQRTMDPVHRGAFRRSRYHLKVGGRTVLGTAAVEAVAMGCIALGDPSRHIHGCLFSRATSVQTFPDAMARMRDLERNHALYKREVGRQRRLVDYLCFVRPTLDLLRKADQVTRARADRLA
jgi:hypothetical protein